MRPGDKNGRIKSFYVKQRSGGSLKSKRTCRNLPLAEDTVSILNEQKKKVGSSPWVFPSATGGPISPDSVLHMLHRVLKRAGLPEVRFHDLRHPYVKSTTKKYLFFLVPTIQLS